MLGKRRFLLVAFCLLLFCSGARSQDDTNSDSAQTGGVQWKSLLEQSFYFIAIENGFRVVTQPETRATMKGPFFQGYARSIDNLHGWGDGDPFFVNYIGHPMQGSVSGFVFVQNDPKYRKAVFGRNRAYWKSRLRAAAWAWVYSEQFEIGPISEATIGHTQAYFPQQGFVDHVITPTMGLAWMIGEDSVDKYLVERIEAHTQNRYLKMFARAGLNPSRSMANMLRGEQPWHRDTRPGLFRNHANAPMLATESYADPVQPLYPAPRPVPMLEIGMAYDYFQLSHGEKGSQSCNGGGATVLFNVDSWFGVVAEVSGCKMASPGENISGDSTTYVAGPRFSFRAARRWTPYLQILGGGDKFTTETMNPDKRPPQSVLDDIEPYVAHSLYTSADQRNSWALAVGGGIDYDINSALGLRIVELEDVHTWAGDLNHRFYPNNLRVSTGFVLNWGNW